MVLGIYGAGPTAQELYEMIIEMDEKCWEKIVFIDDKLEEGTFQGCERVPFSVFQEKYGTKNARLVIAMGEPLHRDILYKKCKNAGYHFATIIHPSSSIAPTAQIGEGCVIRMHSRISSNSRIGNNVYVQIGTVIGHDVVIGDSCQVSASHISGHCTIGERVFIGVNATLRENISIGNNVIIAMAAAVMKDVEENATIMGNPARVMARDSNHKVF